MRILGISSATKVVSIGLIDESRVLVETTVAGSQSERIIFYVKEAGIEPEQIDAVAVAIGPGSYSGLRGSVTAAKTLAQALKVPIASVNTLEAIAFNLIDIHGTMAVMLEARADEYNFALFSAKEGKLQRLTDDLVMKQAQIVAKLKGVTGELHLVGATQGLRADLAGSNYLFADETHSIPYGINVARLGLARIKAGQQEDPLSLAPQYSHRPNIREYPH
ncbi:MAG: tRNA (adenosine(37)-N6)-threonylcarbamoyltransferase complex dimerization subunit type 1 TsaB [Candidatus Margulisbacteria bacterium]|nr:tRNA (adenosine(37)-N6)-threonylcarbamoyltransferase complex dimerization subunit type 1 TsaB [Candidatus Margulisiibacteriota bacterium]